MAHVVLPRGAVVARHLKGGSDRSWRSTSGPRLCDGLHGPFPRCRLPSESPFPRLPRLRPDSAGDSFGPCGSPRRESARRTISAPHPIRSNAGGGDEILGTLALRRRVNQDGRATLIVDRNPAGHEAQDHVDIVALPDEKFEFVFIERSQNALGKFLSRNWYDGDRGVLGDAGAVFEIKGSFTRGRGRPKTAPNPCGGAEVEGRGNARHRREMHRPMMAGPRDVQ